MSDSQLQKSLKQFEEEPKPLFDVIVDPDGRVRNAGERPAGLERQKLVELKGLIERVQIGEADLPELTTRLQQLQNALKQAIGQCHEVIKAHKKHAAYFEANIEAYQRSIEGIVIMLSAIEGDDIEILWQGMAAFESAVMDLDNLVKPDG